MNITDVRIRPVEKEDSKMKAVASITIDGDFGTKTETAVKNFQKKYKLDVDGIYGEASDKAMKNALNKIKTEEKKKKETTTTKPKVETTFKSYKVKVTASALNVRREPNLNAGINTVIKRGEVYTIVDEKDGFGKLKSGAGWIMLKYTQKV